MAISVFHICPNFFSLINCSPVIGINGNFSIIGRWIKFAPEDNEQKREWGVLAELGDTILGIGLSTPCVLADQPSVPQNKKQNLPSKRSLFKLLKQAARRYALLTIPQFRLPWKHE